MSIPTDDGLIWRSEWEGPGEGAFSIGAKAALVNSVPFNRLKNWVQDRNYSNDDLGWPVARSFLASKRFRFCYACLTTGYHAAIFQLWGLPTCPIHNKPLQDRCRHCSHPTPLFELRDRFYTKPVLSPTLSCPHCLVPFAGSEQGLDPRNWSTPLGIESLEDLLSDYSWLNSPDFMSGLENLKRWQLAEFFGEDAQDEATGKRLFSVYSYIFGQNSEPDPRSLVLGPFGDGCPSSVGAGLSVKDSPTQLEVGACEDLDRYKALVTVPSHGVPVPLSSTVPYMAHAATLWKRQYPWSPFPTSGDFLLTNDYGPYIKLLNSAGHRAHDAAWVAARRIARQWNDQLAALEAANSDSLKAASLLATTAEWTPRLGKWRKAKYSPVLVTCKDTYNGPHTFLSVP
ncbi:hypothetical protein [Roseateles asaccharophilus]|uniref:TniQ protein n=1 Tax=Roseateles asaccharophilus TaxID=582607 RepID=A0ABU2AAW0_9BURK|nr:hypothetical protein [Roseateles asaccharophilus]MDR7334337.1 hypothetical protein [Roseateles asaccharophilus]